MTERNLHQDMTEAERRISNVALMGQVVALDTARARVRLQAGPIPTGWLPFATVRAGQDRTWHPPEPGEQVLLVAPGGDLNQAVVVGSIYRSEHPAPADSADISRTGVQITRMAFTGDRFIWLMVRQSSSSNYFDYALFDLVTGRLYAQNYFTNHGDYPPYPYWVVPLPGGRWLHYTTHYNNYYANVASPAC